MKRWKFLQENLPKYLANPYFAEIIIVDETGEDYEILKSVYVNEPRIKVFCNEKRLGPFHNKLECMKRAQCEWILLMDSDNFADMNYFESLFKYFDKTNTKRVYMPSKAMPDFDYSFFSGMTLTPKFMGSLLREKKDKYLTTCFNTGNYLLSKTAVDTILRYREDGLSNYCFCYDVLYSNILLLKNGFDFFVVPDMTYRHVVHEGSVYFELKEHATQAYTYLIELFNQVCLEA